MFASIWHDTMGVEVNDNMDDESEIRYPFCTVEADYAMVECRNTNCTNGQWFHFECRADLNETKPIE